MCEPSIIISLKSALCYRVLFLRQRSSHLISTAHSTSSSAYYNDIHRCWGRARANSGYQALISIIRPGYEAMYVTRPPTKVGGRCCARLVQALVIQTTIISIFVNWLKQLGTEDCYHVRLNQLTTSFMSKLYLSCYSCGYKTIS